MISFAVVPRAALRAANVRMRFPQYERRCQPTQSAAEPPLQGGGFLYDIKTQIIRRGAGAHSQSHLEEEEEKKFRKGYRAIWFYSAGDGCL